MTMHIARMLRIVPYIPRQPQKKSTSEIHEYLESLGLEVSKRQLERDLLQLQSVFPLACDDEKKRGWFWPKDAALPFSGLAMDSHAALVLRLAEQHLKHALPKGTLRKLARSFQEAEHVLAHERKGKATDWLERVHILMPGVPLEPPDIDEQIETMVSIALLEHRPLAVKYRKRGGEEKSYVLHPAGVVVRMGVVYFVAKYEGVDELRFFALHRMREAEVLTEQAQVVPVQELKDTLARGAFGFPVGNESMRVTLRFRPEAGVHLLESRFSADQTADTLADGRLELEGSLPNNLESRWWLLSFGPGVEVVKPESLRNEVATLLRQALNLYEAKPQA
ncbi:MAG: WYL domain-containing protein [Rhodocyclaceae bacterium]|jgi:predicted DNA-binding transcriptional regulator YafY|nr:WYL domain-containing protein [Rhodocyclaceae bacterium]